MKTNNALEKAISLAGTQTALSQASGIKQQNISYWLTRCNGKVPAEYVHDLCAAVGGQLNPNDFRPDIFKSAA